MRALRLFDLSKTYFPTCTSQLFFVVLLLTNLINSTSANAPSPTTTASYTSGIAEEKCVLEEEFHGASSLMDDKRHKRRWRGRHGKAMRFPEHDTGSKAHDSEIAWWEDEESDGCIEDMPLSTTTDDLDDTHPENTGRETKHRWQVWRNKRESNLSTEDDSTLKKSTTTSPTLDTLEEHPMRTDEWEFDIKLSRLFQNEHDLFPECPLSNSSNNKRRFRKRQVMQFARNGYVKVIQDEQFTCKNMDTSFVPSSPTAEKLKRSLVGKWRIGHSGVVFDIPVSLDRNGGKAGSNVKKNTVLHYHADIHLNKFGKQPRMFRGVITRDRYSSILPPNFLRPVIATFSAQGIGRDTADTRYKERGLGLSRQQVIQKQ